MPLCYVKGQFDLFYVFTWRNSKSGYPRCEESSVVNSATKFIGTTGYIGATEKENSREGERENGWELFYLAVCLSRDMWYNLLCCCANEWRTRALTHVKT